MSVSRGPDGMIRIRYGEQPSSLLQTKIQRLNFTKLQQYNIRDALDALVEVKEVRAAVAKLRLAEPGIFDVSGTVQDPMEGVPRLPRNLMDMSLDQSLDLVAKTFGCFVVYEECVRPNGTRFFEIYGSYILDGKWFEDLRTRWDKLCRAGFQNGGLSGSPCSPAEVCRLHVESLVGRSPCGSQTAFIAQIVLSAGRTLSDANALWIQTQSRRELF